LILAPPHPPRRHRQITSAAYATRKTLRILYAVDIRSCSLTPVSSTQHNRQSVFASARTSDSTAQDVRCSFDCRTVGKCLGHVLTCRFCQMPSETSFLRGFNAATRTLALALALALGRCVVADPRATAPPPIVFASIAASGLARLNTIVIAQRGQTGVPR
jgi:hypothetical protein